MTSSLRELPHRSQHNHTYLRVRSVSLSLDYPQNHRHELPKTLVQLDRILQLGICSSGYSICCAPLNARVPISRTHVKLAWWHIAVLLVPLQGDARQRQHCLVYAAADGRRYPAISKLGRGGLKHRGCPLITIHTWTHIKEATIL